LSILADEYEAGQEDRFQGNDHRQQSKWEGIKFQKTGNSVERNPDDKPGAVEKQKLHTATKPRYPIGNTEKRSRVLFHFLVYVTRHSRSKQFISTSLSVSARAVAVRGPLSSIASSPNMSPCCAVVRTIF
jgi:hypothetical protein